MTGWIIFLGITLIVAVWFGHRESKKPYSDGATIGLMSFVGFLIATVPTAVIMCLIAGFSPPTSEVETKELQAISTGSSISGSFFLLSGYLEGELVYTYLEGNPVDGVVYKSIDADDAIIYESSSNPRIEFHYEIVDSPFAIGGPWKFIDYINVYVPEGSIQNGYTISP